MMEPWPYQRHQDDSFDFVSNLTSHKNIMQLQSRDERLVLVKKLQLGFHRGHGLQSTFHQTVLHPTLCTTHVCLDLFSHQILANKSVSLAKGIECSAPLA